MEKSSCCWGVKSLVFAFLFFSLVVAPNVYAQEDADGIPTDEAIISSGKTLYDNNCKVCHAVHEQVVGPALKEVYVRRPLPWLNSFIKNSQQVIQSGDAYAVDLYNKFNKTLMPSFDFSDDEVLSILAYIKAETAKGPATAQAQGTDAASAAGGQQAVGDSAVSGYVNAILIALVVVLILILVVLAILISVVSKYIRQKGNLDEADQEIVDQKFDFSKFVKSPGFIWIVTFIFTAIVLKSVIDGLFSIGVQKGYAPTQPIAFSHKLHAGQYEIDCNYCHTGVRISKSANIPSPNICMNCHSTITKIPGTDELSPEIKKIHDAVENNQPIEWVRVHNLPDLAYFNHAQHVEVGGVECQTCHGPIEEMEVVKQHTNLTMGWCIDCHRTTDVNTQGNAYYDELVELHSKKHNVPMKVEDIGGLECAKCHY